MSIHNRKGKLEISVDCIYQAPEAVQAILSNAIIVRAEMDFLTDKVQYQLMHPQFREINKGEIIPRYEAIYETNNETGECTVTFNEQEYP